MPPGPDDPWDDVHSVAAPLTAWADDDVLPPDDRNERYEVRGSVGQGGMGQVDVVRDRWLDRDVAKKVLHDGVRDARLAREAAITARLEHPGIVPIFDTGLGDDGRRFYTMRLVRGQTLMDALNTASLAQRLEHVRALLAAANAVAHAHSVGIVHRDLKPSNILLGRFGQVVVVDWGIAHDIGADGRPEGTPGYSHPAKLAGDTVSPTHDVYALGHCLLHLLTGQRPTEPASIPSHAPPELVAIAECAVGPTPYQDAAEVAVDLEAYLDGRRVSVHAYSTRELFYRFVRAFYAPLIVGATGVVAIAIVIAVSVTQTTAERDRAVAAEATANHALGDSLTAQAVSYFEDGQYAEAERAAAKALTLGDFPQAVGVLAAAHGTSVRWLSSIEPLCDDVHVQFNGEVGCVYPDRVDIHEPTGELIRTLPQADAQSVRRVTDGYVTAAYMNDPSTPYSRVTYFPQTGEPVSQVVDAGRVALGAANIHAFHSSIEPMLWNVLTNTLNPWLPCPAPTSTATGRPRWRDDGVLGWSCDAQLAWGTPPTVEGRVDLDSPVATTGWSNGLLVASTYDGSLRAYDDGQLAWSVPTPGGTAEELTTQDDWIIAQPERSGPQLFDSGSMLWHRALPLEDAGPLRLHQGRLTTIGSRVSTWSVGPASRPHNLPMPGGVTSVSWSESGQLAVSAGGLVVFVGERGERSSLEQAGCRPVKDLAWQGEDRVVRQCAGSGASLAWLSLTSEFTPLVDVPPGSRVVASDDWVLSSSYGHGVFRVRQDEGQDVVETYIFTDNVIDVELARGGDSAFLLEQSGTVLSLGEQGEPISHGMRNGARGIAVSPSEDALVISTRNTVARVSLTNDEKWLLSPPSRPTDLAWSDQGDLVAIGLLNGQTWVVDADSGALLAVLVGHNERVSAVAFSADGELLATGSWDRSVRLWDATALRSPPTHSAILRRYGW